MDVPKGLGMFAVGGLFVLYGLSVTYGLVGQQWHFVQRARAAYIHRAPSMTFSIFSPSRLIVMTPRFGLAGLFAGVGTLLPADLRVGQLLALVGAGGAFLLCFAAAIWPRPFLPGWAREADARRKAGLPPTVPEPEELAQGRGMSKRQWAMAHAGMFAAVFANTVLHVGPSSLIGPLVMGWAFLAAAQARARSSGGDHVG